MARTDLQVNFRMPAELKERLEQAAKESGRSITSELVHRLRKSLDQDQPPKTPRVFRDDIDETITVNTKVIEQIADKVAERLKDDK